MTPDIEPGRIQVSAGYSLTAGKASQLVVISGGRCEQLFLEANEREKRLRYWGSAAFSMIAEIHDKSQQASG